MTSKNINIKQLSHDLRSLVEPLEIVETMCKQNKIEQALKIQTAAIKALKKTLNEVESALAFNKEQES